MRKLIGAVTIFSLLAFGGLMGGCADKGDTQTVLPTEQTVVFSSIGGTYDKEFNLTLSTEEEGDIYYTTDGSNPVDSSSAIKYDGAIAVKDREGDANVVSAVPTTLISANFCEYSKTKGLYCTINSPVDSAVDKCTVIRAVVKKDGSPVGEVCTQTYFIGKETDHIAGIEESCEAAGKPLAVINISVNYDDLFDPATGIYVKGNVFDDYFKNNYGTPSWFDVESARKFPANYNQKGREWEREAHIDVFEMTGDSTKLILNQDCGIRIQGNYSRSDLQKGFRLYARSDYGSSKFNCALFDDESITEYDTLVLRAGGNCAFIAKYNDTFWQTLAADVACATKQSRPCVVYINGEYWGLYILEEDYSADYFETHYGVDKDEVIVYKGDAETYASGYKLDEGEVPAGEDEDYYFRELFAFFDSHKSLSDDADYEEFCKLVDEQSVMDYFAVESWINNKWDWPGKNWSMWRTVNVDESNEYADARFRFCLYDVEFGGISGKSDAATNTIKEDNYKPKGLLDMNTNNPAVLSFAYLMTNDKFKEAFCERLQNLSTTCFEESRALSELYRFRDTYGPLLEQFYDRYPGTGDAENAESGGYGSAACLEAFINQRAKYIPNMVNWVNKQ